MAAGPLSVVSADWATEAVESMITVMARGPWTFLAVPVDTDGLGACASAGTSRGTKGVVGDDHVTAAAMELFKVLHALMVCWPRL